MTTVQDLIQKYGSMFYMYANIEAIRQSGKTNMFAWNDVKYLYKKYFPLAEPCPDETPMELLMFGLPKELSEHTSFLTAVQESLSCIENNVPMIFAEIDSDNIDESIQQIAKEYDLRPSQVNRMKEMYLAAEQSKLITKE